MVAVVLFFIIVTGGIEVTKNHQEKIEKETKK
jgi:hypothetical protein